MDKSNPLWLPVGSVRAVMALAILGTWLAHIILVAAGEFEFVDFVFTAHSAAAGWIGKTYYDTRENDEDAAPDS